MGVRDMTRETSLAAVLHHLSLRIASFERRQAHPPVSGNCAALRTITATTLREPWLSVRFSPSVYSKRSTTKVAPSLKVPLLSGRHTVESRR